MTARAAVDPNVPDTAIVETADPSESAYLDWSDISHAEHTSEADWRRVMLEAIGHRGTNIDGAALLELLRGMDPDDAEEIVVVWRKSLVRAISLVVDLSEVMRGRSAVPESRSYVSIDRRFVELVRAADLSIDEKDRLTDLVIVDAELSRQIDLYGEIVDLPRLAKQKSEPSTGPPGATSPAAALEARDAPIETTELKELGYLVAAALHAHSGFIPSAIGIRWGFLDNLEEMKVQMWRGNSMYLETYQTGEILFGQLVRRIQWQLLRQQRRRKEDGR